jgi:hypothetical protein
MYRTQHHHHLTATRRQTNVTSLDQQAVKHGHEFAWEFGGVLERSDWLLTAVPESSDCRMCASLDKVLALAG